MCVEGLCRPDQNGGKRRAAGMRPLIPHTPARHPKDGPLVAEAARMKGRDCTLLSLTIGFEIKRELVNRPHA
jgi:hypothetical protein